MSITFGYTRNNLRVASTYDVANISTLDKEGARKCRLLIPHGLGPLLCPAVGPELPLQITQLAHVVKVQTHVRGEDGADHEVAHLGVAKGGGPVTSEDLRVGGAVERFENGSVVVQLGEWRIQRNQEAVIDPRVADIVANGSDEEGQSLKRADELRHWRFGTGLG